MSRVQAWIRERPVQSDAILALALLAIATGGLVSAEGAQGSNDPDALAFALIAATTLPLALRRVRPTAVLFVVSAANIAFLVADYPFPFTVAMVIAIYTVAAHRPRSDAILANGAVGVVTVVVFTIGIRVDDTFGWAEYFASLAILASAWLFGDANRTRREYIESVEERARRAEAQQAEEARRAVAAERVRIARELHDVVAHNMSVLVIQAGAAQRVLERSPQQARDALEAIETTGREALEEMRLLLGVLRDDTADTEVRAPQPGVAQLQDLIDHCEEAGLAVELAVRGETRPLPPAIGLSAYRVVQEALTNAIKHAGPAEARVEVTYGRDALEIVVSDDGRGAGASVVAGGQGHIGMRERVDLYGGALAHGPRVGGGYEVRATFPLELVSAS